jgi:hypothetical protein
MMPFASQRLCCENAGVRAVDLKPVRLESVGLDDQRILPARNEFGRIVEASFYFVPVPGFPANCFDAAEPQLFKLRVELEQDLVLAAVGYGNAGWKIQGSLPG